VDLGVDYGYSTFCFALPGIGNVCVTVADAKLCSSALYSLFRDVPIHFCFNTIVTYTASTLSKRTRAMSHFKAQHSFDNVHVLMSDFAAMAAKWNQPVDILHIDGTHTLVRAISAPALERWGYKR
jgi:hypothetical protein